MAVESENAYREILTYNEALAYIQSFATFKKEPGTRVLRNLLKHMGEPQKSLKFIHIAGTNGKGSTCVMLATALEKAGYKTGLYISPYVICFRERMQINREMITEEDLILCTNYVKKHWESMNKSKEDSLTQFDIQTAISFYWYKQKACDIVCLETGLGGRLDATNVIETGVVQVITAIGLDHTHILGNTFEEIAYEKAGIIKAAPTVVYPLQPKSALEVIKKRCHYKQSRCIIPSLEQLAIGEEDGLEQSFTYKHEKFVKSLNGVFQIYNALVVYEVIHVLQKLGWNITIEDLKYGISHAYIPSRMEVLSNRPLIILDGAHNPSGAAALVESLKPLKVSKRIAMMGILKDKAHQVVIKEIASFVDALVIIELDNKRALSIEALQEEAKPYCKQIKAYKKIEEAVKVTLEELQEDEVLIICGSLYLAEIIRPLIINRS